MDIGENRVNLLSKRIIGCALTVLHALGTGFLEKVYENALVHELRKSGLAVSQQHPMLVRYDGIVVGDYTVDLLVEQIVLVELSESHGLASLPAAQLRQASPCDQTHRAGPVSPRRPLRVLRDLRFHFLPGPSPRPPFEFRAIPTINQVRPTESDQPDGSCSRRSAAARPDRPPGAMVRRDRRSAPAVRPAAPVRSQATCRSCPPR